MDHLRQDIIKPIYLRSSFDTIRPASSGGGGEVPDDVDDGDHFDECSPFFLSYARAAESPAAVAATENADHYVAKLFQDLSENVGQLIGLRLGVEAGFMDRQMRGGMQWHDELLHAL